MNTFWIFMANFCIFLVSAVFWTVMLIYLFILLPECSIKNRIIELASPLKEADKKDEIK